MDDITLTPAEQRAKATLNRLNQKRLELTKKRDKIEKEQLAPIEVELKSVLDEIIRINRARNSRK